MSVTNDDDRSREEPTALSLKRSCSPGGTAESSVHVRTRKIIRSKNGCLTCLRRKVKCDELRSTCGNCSRLRLECGWRGSDTRHKTASASVASSASESAADGDDRRALGGQAFASANPVKDASARREFQSQPAPNATQRVEEIFNYASFMWTESSAATPSIEQLLQPDPQQPYQAPFTDSLIDIEQRSNGVLEAAAAAVMAQQGPLGPGYGKDLDIRDSVFGLLTLFNSPSGGSPEYLQSISGAVVEGHACWPETRLEEVSARPELDTGSNAIVVGNSDKTVAGAAVLLNHFLTKVIPPIIVSVETEAKWTSLRKTLMSMAQSSTLVYNSILAFSELHFYRQSNRAQPTTTSVYYDNATREVEEILRVYRSGPVPDRTILRNILSGLFFLSYVDLISEPGCERVNVASKRLKDAFELVRSSKYSKISAIESRLLSWLRLLDARAYTAGSDGLFLSEDSPTLYSEDYGDEDDDDDDVEGSDADNSELSLAESGSSATSRDGRRPSKPGTKAAKDPENDIQDILYSLILQPGVVFFQKVQSFMCRITAIDRWHRPRGTVQDEFEVMKIADEITKDLGKLWDARPPLMDHAVQGRLTDAHLGAKLAKTVTLNFRVYMCNYYAAFVHLQRVAYVQYPSTLEVLHAVDIILSTAKLLEDGDDEGHLTASMLWPLVMCGSELKNKDDREWILQKLRKLDRITANGKMTAEVLEHVQMLQDQTGQRADIRTVMMHVFNSAFAIL